MGIGETFIYPECITHLGYMKQIGVSKIDERNRTRIPLKVLKFLPKGDRISWELNSDGIICVFMGHERFLRNAHNMGDK